MSKRAPNNPSADSFLPPTGEAPEVPSLSSEPPEPPPPAATQLKGQVLRFASEDRAAVGHHLGRIRAGTFRGLFPSPCR